MLRLARALLQRTANASPSGRTPASHPAPAGRRGTTTDRVGAAAGSLLVSLSPSPSLACVIATRSVSFSRRLLAPHEERGDPRPPQPCAEASRKRAGSPAPVIVWRLLPPARTCRCRAGGRDALRIALLFAAPTGKESGHNSMAKEQL